MLPTVLHPPSSLARRKTPFSSGDDTILVTPSSLKRMMNSGFLKKASAMNASLVTSTMIGTSFRVALRNE
jgi:hypothetical protein